ncbi:MAG: acyl-CoA dehydrogenase [Dehalococcoidia bacterium]|nr:acyl-CoA dehydrogenase [Dehalococcoidia bacterium]MQG15512.1 acyl-CoA dehydrogenase [SAR202 cluster bacterium]|tara:strand:- start:19338 stop:20483 length:1146 start_codon:yes stop_codon:yes gene_type:complete
MIDPHLNENDLLLRKTIRDFVDRELIPNASKYDLNEKFPHDAINKIAEMGLFRLGIDETFGGVEGTNMHLAIATEEIARGCASTAVIYASHMSLCSKYIELYGDLKQKSLYLPRLVEASTIGALALTEPDAGSDVASIKTLATKVDEGFIINGSKHFITNGQEAGIVIVVASTDPGLGSKGLETFILEAPSEGLTVTPQQGKLGIRASSTCELNFNNVFIPNENRLGKASKGFHMTMQVLDAGRILIAAQSVGIAQMALEISIQYAQQRKAFGNYISEFQAIQNKLADMATEIQAARLLTYRSAALSDYNQPFETEASMAKLYASKVAVESANQAVQIHGGIGYFAPNIAERLYRDAKVTEIYEGTSEIQRILIARSLLSG